MNSFPDSDLVFIKDLQEEFSKIPPDSIISRTILNNERLKVVLFNFAPGQELSEHTASMPAVVHILQGEAQLILGGDEKESTTGSWAYMPANLPHSVYAKTFVTMLLLMIKNS